LIIDVWNTVLQTTDIVEAVDTVYGQREATDLVVGGKPKNAKEIAEAGSTLIDMLGEHSGKVNKVGMQPDHTKTPAVKPKPVIKPQPKPQLPKIEPQPIIRTATT
jgi:hypothetical protein